MSESRLVTPGAVKIVSASWGAAENPLASFGGPWKNGKTDGIDWQDVRIATDGILYGTETGSAPGSGHPNYDDSVFAHDGSGWSQNQYVEAIVKISAFSTTAFQELELWTNVSIAGHSIIGIETNFRTNPNNGNQYIGVVRWNGVLNDFTQYGSNDLGPGIVDGDKIAVRVSGNTHEVLVNGSVVTTHDLSSLPGGKPIGNPGGGHWHNLNGASGPLATDHGLRNWKAANY